MEPIRKVEVLARGDFVRSSEMQLAPPVHWTIPTTPAVEAYLDFLDSLDPIDRETYVITRFLAGARSGRLAEQRDYDDIVRTPIGICGSTEPFISLNSARMNAEVETLEQQWQAFATERSVADGTKKFKWPDDYGAIELGFQRLVAEVIYGDYGDGRLTERAEPHIEAMMLDPISLRGLVTQWIAEQSLQSSTSSTSSALNWFRFVKDS